MISRAERIRRLSRAIALEFATATIRSLHYGETVGKLKDDELGVLEEHLALDLPKVMAQYIVANRYRRPYARSRNNRGDGRCITSR